MASSQLKLGLKGVQKPRLGGASRASRKLSVIVRAEKEDFGTRLLRGLSQSLGTVSIGTYKAGGATANVKAGKQGGTSFLTRNVPDGKTVFVAGSTGRTGARVVRELLKAGYRVRAGARNVKAAQQAADVAEAYGLLSAAELKNLSIVDIDLSKPDSIKAAIGPARKVVCALGAAEAEALNFSAPKKVDGDYTINLINGAASAGVEQFVLVTSLGTGKVGWPASVLNLFGGVLYWKRKSEEVLEASGMAYTIVRPGGMERPTDSYKKTHRMVLSPRDTKFGGQVSRLQVAELIESIIGNPDVSANKVLEVTAETTAPQQSYAQLLQTIKPDFSMEEQASNKEVIASARADVDAAEEKLAAAKAALASADSRVKDLQERLKTARAQEAEVKAKVAPVLKQGESAEKALNAAKANLDKAVARESAVKAQLDAARKAGAQGQLLDKKQLKAVADQVLVPPRTASKQVPALAAAGAGAAAAAAAKPLFGFLGGNSQEVAAPAAPAKQPPAVEKKSATPEPAAKPAKSAGGFNFGSLLGIPEPMQVEEGAKAPAVPARDATPAPAAPKVAPKAPATPSGTQKLQVAPKQPREASPVQSLFGGFGGFGSKPAEPETKQEAKPAPAEAAPAKPAEAAAPAPAPPKPVAAAPKPAPAAAKAEEPKAAPAPPKPSVPVEDPADVERRMLAALQEEKRSKALAVAKARLEAEAKAIEAAKAAALREAAQTAPAPPAKPSPPPRPAAPAKPAVAAAPAAAAKPAAAAPAAAAKPAAAAPAAAPAKAAAGEDDAARAAAIAAEKKKVQAWIAAWQAKQGGAAGSSQAAAPAAKPAEKPAAAAKPAAAEKPAEKPAAAAAAAEKKGDGYDFEAAAKAKAEAQAWIAAWQAKQAAKKK